MGDVLSRGGIEKSIYNHQREFYRDFTWIAMSNGDDMEIIWMIKGFICNFVPFRAEPPAAGSIFYTRVVEGKYHW